MGVLALSDAWGPVVERVGMVADCDVVFDEADLAMEVAEATRRSTTTAAARERRWCSAQEAAEHLGTTRQHVYRLLANGTLRGRRVRGHSGQTRVWRVDFAHLAAHADYRTETRHADHRTEPRRDAAARPPRRRLCSVAEAAARLGISDVAVRSRLRTGSLLGRQVRSGCLWRVDVADLEDLVARLAARPEMRGSWLRAPGRAAALATARRTRGAS